MKPRPTPLSPEVTLPVPITGQPTHPGRTPQHHITCLYPNQATQKFVIQPPKNAAVTPVSTGKCDQFPSHASWNTPSSRDKKAGPQIPVALTHPGVTWANPVKGPPTCCCPQEEAELASSGTHLSPKHSFRDLRPATPHSLIPSILWINRAVKTSSKPHTLPDPSRGQAWLGLQPRCLWRPPPVMEGAGGSMAGEGGGSRHGNPGRLLAWALPGSG